MSPPDHEPARWTADEIRRDEAARAERLRRDAESGPDRNLDDGVRLIEFARRFAAAFRADQPSG